jgi:hypothetical protein
MTEGAIDRIIANKFPFKSSQTQIWMQRVLSKGIIQLKVHP